MGNLDAKRDWGHARDYVYMQWLMLQQEKPDDYVIASGEQFSVRDFIFWTAEELGFEISFKGSGLNEIGEVTKLHKKINLKVGDVVIKVDSKYYRPTEVSTLLGSSEKAKKLLNWTPKYSARELCREMVKSDYEILARDEN
jgi:GDPmannose 4,6-dehydratase